MNKVGGEAELSKEQVKNLVLTTLISADYEGLTEDEKQGILSRMEEKGYDDVEYILEPIKSIEQRDRFIKLLK